MASFAACAQPGGTLEPAIQALRTQHAVLLPLLSQSEHKLPLVIRSQESGERVVGEVFAELDFRLEDVAAVLANSNRWCDIMVLHSNTKYCRASGTAADARLAVYIGKKTPQFLADAQRVDFRFRLITTSPDYFLVTLDASQGPLGTSDYRMEVQSVSLSPHSSFVHLTYAYSVNVLGRIAVKTYLASAGRDKVGFTRTDASGTGPPQYVDGMRGMVERNAMRYYLAILAHLQSGQLPAPERLDASLKNWFAATERYPRQLHEANLQDYLAMKHAEIVRQKLAP